jgi:hypothetical protein
MNSKGFLCRASLGIVISNTAAYFTKNNIYTNNPGSDGIELANVQNRLVFSNTYGINVNSFAVVRNSYSNPQQPNSP